MITSLMSSKFLERHDVQVTSPVLKRTRASTRKFVENNKFTLETVKSVDEAKIFSFILDGRKHEIKVEAGEDDIAEVSCADCSDFCRHSQVLLNLIAQDPQHIKEEIHEEKIAKKSKRIKLDKENNSSSSNEIKLTKKKKQIELPYELLASVQVLKMESLIRSFGRGTYKEFQDYCIKVLKEQPKLAELANELTVEQADTTIWHDLRIGRVTASRLHETTRCTMVRGSLVDKYLGKKSGWSFAMMRGTVLEEFVFEEVKKEFPELKRSGLIINPNVHPFFAASPDGLHTDFVLEIKCPSTENTFKQYIDVDKLSRKYFAQIQLQMFVTGQTKALLAVAHLDFEKTRNITKVWIEIDNEYIDTMIAQAEEFYEKAIFPALKRKFL